jgi:hypothetical protein
MPLCLLSSIYLKSSWKFNHAHLLDHQQGHITSHITHHIDHCSLFLPNNTAWMSSIVKCISDSKTLNAFNSISNLVELEDYFNGL